MPFWQYWQTWLTDKSLSMLESNLLKNNIEYRKTP
uniref:Uncharacterized protein n=1 Tax=Tetranychus urticae TaxID=32264 RepID=T1KX94_TETUR